MTLQAEGLVCSYGPTRALAGVDATAEHREILAVFGPNGAGKTTLLRALSGERRLDAGRVLFDGEVVSGADPAWRSRVGVVSHRTGLYGKLTAIENLRFFGSLRGRPTGRKALVRALDTVGAGSFADVPVAALSRGQRQRAALARSLLHEPDVVFLDEPFTGLDPAGAAALEEILQGHGEGRVVVLVTHDVVRGLRLANRILVLRRGRVVLEGVAGEVTAEQVTDHFSVAAGEAA